MTVANAELIFVKSVKDGIPNRILSTTAMHAAYLAKTTGASLCPTSALSAMCGIMC